MSSGSDSLTLASPKRPKDDAYLLGRAFDALHAPRGLVSMSGLGRLYTPGVLRQAFGQVVGNHPRGVIPSAQARNAESGYVVGALRSREHGRPGVIIGISNVGFAEYRYIVPHSEGRYEADLRALETEVKNWLPPN